MSKQPKHLTLQLGGLILRRKQVDGQQVHRIPFLHAATRIRIAFFYFTLGGKFSKFGYKKLWVVPMHLDAFGLHFGNPDY